jgi:predicted dehydrogenase
MSAKLKKSHNAATMSSASKEIRIGFVGAGSMGQCAHLRNFASPSLAKEYQCKVVALAELRPSVRSEVAEHYGIAHVYETAEELLANEKLDGIVAAQQFDRHGSIIPPLYRGGVPIFTEKPLAASLEVGEKILQALKSSGTWHMLGYHKRSDPATMFVKAEIERLKHTGEIGKLKYVRITMPAGDWIAGGLNDLIEADPNEKPPEIPRDVTEGGGSAYVDFVNYYIHQVNLLRHLLGEPYQVTFADKACVLLAAESASGVTGAIEMSPFTTSLGWQESALIAFEKGYLKLELPAPLAVNQPGRAEIYTEKGTFIPQLPPVHAMRQQAINFVRAIKGEIQPMCEAAEALEDLRIAADYIRLWKGGK